MHLKFTPRYKICIIRKNNITKLHDCFPAFYNLGIQKFKIKFCLCPLEARQPIQINFCTWFLCRHVYLHSLIHYLHIIREHNSTKFHFFHVAFLTLGFQIVKIESGLCSLSFPLPIPLIRQKLIFTQVVNVTFNSEYNSIQSDRVGTHQQEINFLGITLLSFLRHVLHFLLTVCY